MYDIYKYWNKRKNPNSATSEQTQEHIDFVKQNLNKNDFVLDFGCGIGRILPAYTTQKIIGCDINYKYLKEWFRKLMVSGLQGGPFLTRNIEKLPFKNDIFDASVCISVLMHQTPENILNVLTELIRVSKKVIFISYHNKLQMFESFIPRQYDTHCFNYDYDYIIRYILENKFIIKEKSGNQFYGVYKKKGGE